MNNEDDDLFLNSLVLPIDKQSSMTREDRLEYIRKVKNKAKGLQENNILNDKPLSADTIKRGYPPTIEEINTIKIIDRYEKELLNRNNLIKPLNNPDFNYYIVEDGTIFKTYKNKEFYILQTNTMSWILDNTIIKALFKEKIRFSKLINFRDYYEYDIVNDKGVHL